MARITLVLVCCFIAVFNTVDSLRITSAQVNKVAGVLKKMFGLEIDNDLKFKKTYLGNHVHLLRADIQHIDIPSIDVTSSGNYFVVSVRNFGLKAKGYWRYKKTFLWIVPVQESGSLQATVSGMGVTFFISKSSYRVTNCKEYEGNVSGVKLRGKLLAWFARKLFSIKKRIKKSLKGQVCKAVTKGINRHSSQIRKILKARRRRAMYSIPTSYRERRSTF